MSLDEIRDYLLYDCAGGVFTWIRSPGGGVKVGDVAGCPNALGYRQIQFRGHNYLGHQLAWFFVFGIWPTHDIDHRDGVPGHDWITNLRPATHAQNLANAKLSKANKSGFRGVCFESYTQRWLASLKHEGWHLNLGRFRTPDDAARAYDDAARKLKGEFARLNYPDKPRLSPLGL